MDKKRKPGRPRKRPRRGTGGGQAVLERYGVEHYRALSAKGNLARAARRAEADPAMQLVEAHLTLRRGLIERLNRWAKALRITRACLIRLAIDDYLTALGDTDGETDGESRAL